jgi:hypothetical protein
VNSLEQLRRDNHNVVTLAVSAASTAPAFLILWLGNDIDTSILTAGETKVNHSGNKKRRGHGEENEKEETTQRMKSASFAFSSNVVAVLMLMLRCTLFVVLVCVCDQLLIDSFIALCDNVPKNN